MAWVKIPQEHHPLFHAALPKDPRVTTLPMFGGVAAKANGHMFGGLFGRSAIVRLSDADRVRALALDGAEMFDPMRNGRTSKHSIQLPEIVMEEPGELRGWLRKAFDHALTLPTKAPKTSKPTRSTRPTKPTAVKKPKRR